MMTLTALAMNPNLSEAQFQKLAEEHMQSKERCFKIVRDALETMDAETGVKYLVSVLPVLLAW